MDVQLPDVCAGSCTGDAIVLEVLPGPSYRINQQPVAGNQLGQAISAIYDGRPDKTLQVAGSPGVRYEEVIRAMDAAKGSGVRVLAISPKGAR